MPSHPLNRACLKYNLIIIYLKSMLLLNSIISLRVVIYASTKNVKKIINI